MPYDNSSDVNLKTFKLEIT